MRKKGNRIQYDIVDAGASRAVFQGAKEFALIRAELHSSNGDIIELEFDVHTGRKLIEQLATTYHSIVPPLRVNRSNYRGNSEL